jgi:hypothetical protein
MLKFETRGRYSNAESSLETRIGNIFYGTEGYLELKDEVWKAFRKREKEPFAGSKPDTKSKNDDVSNVGSSDTAHFSNFIDAMRSGKDDDLHCDVNEGFFSSTLPLLANISYRLERELKFMGADMDREMVVNDP